MATLPTPAGWTPVVGDAEDVIRANMVADYTAVKEYPQYLQSMRHSTTNPTRWYLLVGRWDGGAFSDVHVYQKDAPVKPAFPVSFTKAGSGATIAIVAGVAGGILILAILAATKRK